VVRLRRFDSGPANGRNRRNLTVRARSGEGPKTTPLRTLAVASRCEFIQRQALTQGAVLGQFGCKRELCASSIPCVIVMRNSSPSAFGSRRGGCWANLVA
jgi:hypothetical protein